MDGAGRSGAFTRLNRRRVLAALTSLTAIERPAAAAGPYVDHTDPAYFLDAAGRRRPVRSPSDWKRRREHVLAAMQEVMGPLPSRRERVPLGVKTEEEVRFDGMIRRKLTYQSTARHRVPAYLFLPQDPPAGGAPAALCLHPTGADGKGIVAGLVGRTNRDYGYELARRDYAVLAPDYPSFGDYACEFRPEEGWVSGTMRAIWDNIRGVDLLCSLPQVDQGAISAIGHSLGGHNAIFTAVFEPRIAAVVSSCGFTRFHRYYGGRLAGWTSPRYMPRIASVYGSDPDRVPFDFPELIAALAPRPFFTNSPLRDDNFDVTGVRETMDAARHVYRVFDAEDRLAAVYPDAAHDFPEAQRRQAYDFLGSFRDNPAPDIRPKQAV